MITGQESRQVSDIPVPKLEVTQHNTLTYCCANCHEENKSSFPESVTAKTQYGERIKGAAIYFNVHQFIPNERCSIIMKDLFGADSLASSSIVNWVDEYARQIRDQSNGNSIWDRIRLGVENSNVRHCDETSVKIKGDTHWLHVFSTSSLTHYRVSPKRGAVTANQEGVNLQGGFLVHDHFKSYYKIEGNGMRHIYCNAHHLRELKKLIEFERNRANEGAVTLRDWFYKAYKTREEAIERGETCLPADVIKSLKREYDEILAQWYVDQLDLRSKNGESRRRKRSDGHNLIRRFQEYKDGVTYFLDDFDVPFTNNQAEQDIRMTKVKEKVSGGFRSSRGAENFAIIRSITSTARKKGVNILQTLYSPISLLPSLLSV